MTWRDRTRRSARSEKPWRLEAASSSRTRRSAITSTRPADDLERLMYGWSIVHCLPVAMADQPSAAIGTVIRADTVRALATAAGLPRVEIVPVDGGFFRLYRLRAQ